MSSAEYQDIVRRLERVERLLVKLAGAEGEQPLPVQIDPPPPVTPEMSARERLSAIQAEGEFILETQGMDAYKAFWKQQGRKRRPGMKRAA